MVHVGIYTCQLVNGIAKWVFVEGSCSATVALSTSSPEALALAVADLIEAGTIDPTMALSLLTDLSNAVVEESGTISTEEEDVRL